MNRDARGNAYLDIKDTRLTLVQLRDQQTDWSRTPTLRIQKYHNPPASQALRPGPEVPVQSKDDLIRIAVAVLRLAELMP